jgi:Protein of unknown function (DUF1552)
MKNFTRRSLFESVGAASLAIPIAALQERLALGQAASAKRVILVFSPNGPVLTRGPADWKNGTPQEKNFKLNPFWSPLEPHIQDGIFISNISNAGREGGKLSEGGHASSGWGSLTGRADLGTKMATGPSFDFLLGGLLAQKKILSPRQNLLFGLHNNVGGWGPWWESSGKVATPNSDPLKILTDLRATFGGTPASSSSFQKDELVAKWLGEDCADFSNSLGKEGQKLFAAHCESIKKLEVGLAQQIQLGQSGMCQVPKNSPQITSGVEGYDTQMDAWASTIALSLACEYTRVIGFSFDGTAGRLAIPASYKVPAAATVDSGDSGSQHHAWTHWYDGGQDKEKALKLFYNWYSAGIAKIWQKLKTTNDASGKPLSDSTVLLWVSELGGYEGSNNPHDNDNVPVILLGSPNGAATGRHLDFKNSIPKIHQLYVSLAHHMGLKEFQKFGEVSKAGEGPLAL